MDPLGSGKAGSPGGRGTFGPHTSTAADATTRLPADLWTVPPHMLTASDSAAAGLEPGRLDVLEGHDGSDAPRPALFGRPVVKVWALTGILAALALVVYAQAVREIVPPSTPIDIPWPVIAVLFGVGELLDVQVHFRRETHAFSLSEFPTVIGLFFLEPSTYLVA